MSMKMKGLLKGLRYISTIFDEEEEAEMQIGFPTDVKHVAHIGWDGPTTNSPSWINQFKDGEGGGGGGGGGGASNVEDQQNAARPRDLRGSVQEKRFPTGPDSPVQSPSRKRSDKSKGSRRANSASSAVESPRRSSTSSETRKQQQQQEQQQQLPPAAAAEGEQTSKTSSRRKKPKSGSSGAQSSSRASNKSKSTAPTENFSHYSDPGVRGNTSRNNVAADQTTGRRAKGKDTCQGSVLKAASDQDDPKSMDDISRGIQAM